jgi:hypothetical protein
MAEAYPSGASLNTSLIRKAPSLPQQILGSGMDKLQLTGQNLCRVFNFRYGHLHAEHFWCLQVKLLNLKLKTRPKQLLGSLPLVIALPGSGKSYFQ